MTTLQELIVPLKMDKSGFDGSLKGAAIGVAALGTAVVGTMALAVKSTFKWAQELDSLQDVMGVTNKQAAALNYILRKSGTDTDTLTKGMTILEKGLVKTDGTLDVTGKKLKEYGINALDVNGKVKDQADLFSEISNKYNSFATQQEKVNFLTDTFGKSGAGLIDVFDTLAQEGGLDKVQAKVEALGLAIDPARYENYTRSLEELKLVGTGLAVSFTEKLMPALESALGWFQDILPKAKKAFESGGLGGLADFIIQELGKLDETIANRLDRVDWSGLGTRFGDWVDGQFSNGFSQHSLMPKFIISFTNGLQDAVLHAALGADPKAAWAAFFDNVHREGDSSTRTFFINWELTWTNGIRGFFNNWEIEWTNGIRNIYNTIVTWLNRIDALFGNNSNIPILPMVNPIGQPVGAPSTTTHGGGGGGGGGTTHSRRASGGSVIAGQTYNVSEFYKPEQFTPNQSGRIDSMQSAAIDENKIGDAIGRRLVRDLPPLLALLKA